MHRVSKHGWNMDFPITNLIILDESFVCIHFVAHTKYYIKPNMVLRSMAINWEWKCMIQVYLQSGA